MTKIQHLISQRTSKISDSFEVGRVLPYRQHRTVGPFVFFDHMGPVNLAAGHARDLDVLAHPHIGLATVTYLFDGAITHRDSAGFKQEIRPGEVNWMVAGRGIVHSERLETLHSQGGTMHGLQTWVALPTELEETTPSFVHYAGSEQLPVWQDQQKNYRLLAGQYAGMRSQVVTQSPLFYLHLTLPQGAIEQVANDYTERAVFVVEGQLQLDNQTIEARQMAVLTPKEDVVFTATQASSVVIIGGESLGERYLDWNFVSSSPERLKQAREAWINGEMELPKDEDTFVPYPEALLKLRVKH